MADIGEIVVRIKADASQLQRELGKATGTVKDSAREMEGAVGSLKDQLRELIPAITLGALVEFGKASIEATSHLGDLAQRIGFAASTLSALESPLKTSGSSLDEFASSMNRLNVNLGEAAKGRSPEAVKAFDDLGLSVKKLLALPQEQRFYAVADALARYTDTSKQAEAANNTMGKGVVGLLPFINEHKEGVEKAVQANKHLKDSLSDETVERVKKFGDALEDAGIRAKNSFIQAFAQILKVTDHISKYVPSGDEMREARLSNYGIAPGGGTPLSDADIYAMRAKAKGFVTSATEVSGYTISGDKLKPPVDPRGGNADLLPAPKDSDLKQYIADLKAETDALGLSDRALFVQRAEIEANAKARSDYGNKLRESKDLLPREKAQVEELAGAFYDLKKAQEENERMARKMREALSDSLADIAVNFENLRDTATSALKAIAKEMIKMQLTDPLAKSLIGSPGSPGLLSSALSFLPHFADGGSPPVGMPSLVGERGPEIFVPNVAGTIIPNGASMGGPSVTVIQNNSFGSGVTRQEIMGLIPIIESRTQASVFAAMERGGKASQIVGKRS